MDALEFPKEIFPIALIAQYLDSIENNKTKKLCCYFSEKTINFIDCHQNINYGLKKRKLQYC